MTLREILKGHSNVVIKEYEPFGSGLILIGGCYYADNQFIEIDGRYFAFDVEINAYEWKKNNVLAIVR